MSVAAKGKHFSDEHKKNLSKAKKGVASNKGSHWSEESKNKLKGRRFSAETRKKISESAKLKIGFLNHFSGKHHSEEARRKMSEHSKWKKRKRYFAGVKFPGTYSNKRI